MKYLVLVLFSVIVSSGFSQSLSDATRLFERFEYAKAAEAYKAVSAKKALQIEDYKRLAYCYYSTGDFESSYPLLDSLVKIKDMDPFFYFAHGKVSMAKGEFTKAKSSYLTYKELDNEFPVDILVASCDSLLVWKPIQLNKLEVSEGNGSKADINGSMYDNRLFIFKEIGIDSSGFELNDLESNQVEVVLAKPFLKEADGTLTRLSLPNEFKGVAITSATLLNAENILLTIAQPLAKDESIKSQHLYIGKWDLQNLTVSNLVPWNFSGFEDSTSCAFATINKAGDHLIFSKLGEKTAETDLYESKLVNAAWTKPSAVTALNTPYDEMFPMFSGDSLLSFASNGRPGYGSLDIFTVSIDNGSFGPIKHLKAPLNSFNDDFNYVSLNDSMAVYSSNRMGGKGDDDFYTVTYEYKKGPSKEELLAIELDKFAKNWQDQRVYFDFEKFDLKDFKVIDSLVFFLNNSPQSYVVIEGHTDLRGTEEYNRDLSDYRIHAVSKELISRGVSQEQIRGVAKGKTEPQINCEKGCTEEQHAKNRVAIIRLHTL